MQVVTKLHPDSVGFYCFQLLLLCRHQQQHYHHQHWKFLLLKSGFDQYNIFLE